jgi:hypothetical protein
MGPKSKSAARSDVAIGESEPVGADAGHCPQPLGLVAVHQVDHHVVPVMAFDLHQRVGAFIRDICLAMPGEETAGDRDQAEAQDQPAQQRRSDETLSTP